MGNLVFQATLGGQVNLVGPNTASTFNINVPTVNGTLVTTGDTGTVTNTMLASSAYTAPGTIGSGTPNTGAFTTLTTTSTINNLTVGRGAGAVSTNTAVGASALNSNTTGAQSVSVGYQAAYTNTAASNLTAVGYQAGYNTTTSSDNLTAVGWKAAFSNTSGASLTALGRAAAYSHTTGSDNTAVGLNSMYYTTTGSNNVSVGSGALQSNTTGAENTAVGYQAGYSVTTGYGNAFYGRLSGQNTTGYNNTFYGGLSGYLVTSGNSNTILGRFNGNQGGLDIRTANNYIVLSDGDGNHRMFINGSGTWFYSTPLASAGTNAVKYNGSTGAISYDTSSARYKDNIRDSVYGLSHVMQMRSAQFEYKDTGRSDVGLIAEELQPIIPELVGVNKEGQADSVSYDRMVSVLVKAIQELKAEFDAYKEAHP